MLDYRFSVSVTSTPDTMVIGKMIVFSENVNGEWVLRDSDVIQFNSEDGLLTLAGCLLTNDFEEAREFYEALAEGYLDFDPDETPDDEEPEPVYRDRVVPVYEEKSTKLILQETFLIPLFIAVVLNAVVHWSLEAQRAALTLLFAGGTCAAAFRLWDRHQSLKERKAQTKQTDALTEPAE